MASYRAGELPRGYRETSPGAGEAGPDWRRQKKWEVCVFRGPGWYGFWNMR